MTDKHSKLKNQNREDDVNQRTNVKESGGVKKLKISQNG